MCQQTCVAYVTTALTHHLTELTLKTDLVFWLRPSSSFAAQLKMAAVEYDIRNKIISEKYLINFRTVIKVSNSNNRI